jgi:GT2 family glycosyltransferase
MKLSVVIVNYNVKYFLEQCLLSVIKASEGLDVEVFVVDNNSVDGSVKMLAKKFPEIKVIENKDNKGFSKANNQAIRIANGEYILLLNPDTVVEEDTFVKVIRFMDEHPEAGGLGVKMFDGKGNFLPESKRGLPKPDVAFYKIFGLSKLFPKSKTFGRYHLGFLDPDKTHEVDVLSGAFMLLRKKALDKVGLLDEDFFMYGEDIDLSYRIIKGGYKNFYFPETRIIHYKGESTKKSSVNYVFVFYNAMLIFARKHFTHSNAKMFSFLINFAVYFRAFAALLSRFAKKISLPVIDAAMIFGGIYFIKGYWENKVIFRGSGTYPVEFITIAVPLYIIIWLFSVYINSGYDKPYKFIKIFRGIFIGTLVILTFYSLLDESHRYSRALIILGSVWAMVSMFVIRYVFQLLKISDLGFNREINRKFIIVGDSDEASRVDALLKTTHLNPGFIGHVSSSTKNNGNGFLGNIDQLTDIIQIYNIDEVIFCSKNLGAQSIIDKMSELQNFNVDYKIAPPESLSIIGSNSINTSGDIYVVNINSISKVNNKRNKFLLDKSVSLSFILFLPVMLLIVKRPAPFIRNIFQVLVGKKSWVGYYSGEDIDYQKLPKIKKGVLNPSDGVKKLKFTPEILSSLNILYAKDYDVYNDLNIIARGIRNTGR